MKAKRLAALIASAAMIAAAWGYKSGEGTLEKDLRQLRVSRPASDTTTTICHEDAPCWDCATMGNKICGTEGP
jgi:hypothetical protein